MPIRPPNEDLFESSRMTFGEHLEELRKVLVRALLGLMVGMAIGLLFAENVVEWLKTPLTRAIADFNVTRAENELKQRNHGVVPLEFRRLLDQRVLAPRRVLVDPEQLERALQQESSAPKVDQVSTISSFEAEGFAPENMRNVCRQLAAAGDAEGISRPGGGDDGWSARRKAIWDLLAENEQSQVKNWSQSESLTDDDVAQFVQLLNRLAQESDLFAQPAFGKLVAGEATATGFNTSEATVLKDLYDRLTDPEARDAAEFRPELNQWLIWSALAPDLPRPDIPFAEIDIWESAEVNAQSLTATEPFMIWMKTGLILGLLIASPWMFYQIWLFIAAGLYPHEQRYVYLYLPISLGLFLAGAGLAFFFVFDPVLKFLLQFNANMGIDPQPRIGDWMSFVLLLPLGFGIAFQLPIVMLFLNLLGIFTVQDYLAKWRVAVLVIFIVSMILTPAEPISMILMAIPLTFLYFLGVAMCRWLRPNRNPYREAYEP